jgi:hypothetical protein
MRTTILLSSLLFLAGYALAQDSPITVGDTGPIIIHRKKSPPNKIASNTSTWVKHAQFQYDGPSKIHHVSDQGYQAACFEMVGDTSNKPRSLSGAQWTLTLNNGEVKLQQSKKDPSRIEIALDQSQVIAHSPAAGMLSLELVKYPLTSATLTVDNGNPTTYTPSGTPKLFEIHYCKGGVCPDPICK